jgi:hypothetical protein
MKCYFNFSFLFVTSYFSTKTFSAMAASFVYREAMTTRATVLAPATHAQR